MSGTTETTPVAERLRLLHVMTRMATAGTERQLVEMARAAHGRCWDAHLCVLFPGHALADEAAEFMPVTQLPYRRGEDPRRPLAVRRLARSIGADVVHPSLVPNLVEHPSIGLGRTTFGIALVLAYGLGMAGTLTAVGLALVRLRSRLAQRPTWSLAGMARAAPVVTALPVLLVGLSLVARGVVLGA